METEKILLRLEETLAQVVRQQEAICAELVGMREPDPAISRTRPIGGTDACPDEAEAASSASL